MALKIPSEDRIINYWDYIGGEPPEDFDPSNPTIVNADWVMKMMDKIVNGNYATKSFNIVPSAADLPNNAEQGQTAYVLNDTNKSSFWIYTGTEWTNPINLLINNIDNLIDSISGTLNGKLDLTGGTLTGVLTSTVINEGGENPTAPFVSKMSNIVAGTYPVTSMYPYVIKIIDGSDNILGSFEYSYQDSKYGVGIVCKKWGEAEYSYLKVGWKDDGGTYFEFPKCTTAATTTSTAAADRVAVITKNYKNDSEWYRVWSDGWIEQGGIATNTGSTTKKTVNLLRTFTDTNYTLVFGVINNFSNNQKWSETVKATDKSTSNFKTVGYGLNVGWSGSFSTSDVAYIANSFNWYACGY